MAQSILSVRVEEETKRHFENFCDSAGLNPSVAINMFIVKTIEELETMENRDHYDDH